MGEGRNAPTPPAIERIVFLPPQPFGEYCRLLQLADVILDPPHYGAGSSCYDLFSFNLPVVTLPGELIVGRITQACYRKMGLEDLVVHSAEDYVSKAVLVATDHDYRQFVTSRIANNSDVLFNDLEAVREHERFFDEALKVCEDVNHS
jgi:predicted O-linked N-acetylglucosamine transferase (SPINDLY family)